MIRIYDPDGKEITVKEWGRRFEKWRPHRTAQVGDWLVSTVYLGLDHSFGAGPPLIYETMIFERPKRWSWRRLRPSRPWSDLYCYRHASREDAWAHHDLVVRVLRHRFHPNELWEVIR